MKNFKGVEDLRVTTIEVAPTFFSSFCSGSAWASCFSWESMVSWKETQLNCYLLWMVTTSFAVSIKDMWNTTSCSFPLKKPILLLSFREAFVLESVLKKMLRQIARKLQLMKNAQRLNMILQTLSALVTASQPILTIYHQMPWMVST